MIILWLLIMLVLNSVSSHASPPKPPTGLAWEKVEILTDEFNNGTQLDAAKWYDYHPHWVGRLPSKFKKGNCFQEDGYLKLRSTLGKDPSTVADTLKDYWVDAAACVSKERSAKPGYYYEARIKASNLSMTSSFWFRVGEYSEIDVIEHIGNPSNEQKTHLEYQYHANTHIYGTKTGSSKAAEWIMPTRGRDEFHVYGFWWKTPDTLWFYHNNTKVMEIVPNTSFAENLKLIFDTEVFPFASAGVANIGIPQKENLQDTSRNTMLVDWVRTYELKTAAISTPTESIKIINLAPTMTSSAKLNISVEYDASTQRDIVVALHNPEGQWTGSAKKTIGSGTGQANLEIDLGTYSPTPRPGHSIRAFLRDPGGDYTTNTAQTSQTIQFLPNESPSGPPPAPLNKTWENYDLLSDEFDGAILDPQKWINSHAGGWDGRDPSEYYADNVLLENNMLQLKSTVKNETFQGNWVHAACVSSPTKAAQPGSYFEASIRGSDISMTSAFWLQGSKTEIDVTENFGYTTKDSDYYIQQRSQMLSNTHAFHNGWDNDITTPMHASLDAESDHRFFTYGVYWKNDSTIIMYVDGDSVNTMKPGAKFNESQYMFFDTETFSWQGFPSLAELQDPDRNTMYVNWVRSYRLIDQEEPTVLKHSPANINKTTQLIQQKQNITIIGGENPRLEIYNPQGMQVWAKEGKSHNLQELNSGIYYALIFQNGHLQTQSTLNLINH